MKSALLNLVSLFLLSNAVFAQNEDNSKMSNNNLYLEFGTNIIVTSSTLNYERHFLSSASENVHLYGRAGLGGAVVFWAYSGWGGLGALTMITGSGNSHFEASGGVFFANEKAPEFIGGKGTLHTLPVLDLGYRYQKPGNGFIFRFKAGVLGVGLGLGYAF